MKIELTETELIHIMDSLNERVKDLRDCDDPESLDLANELEELEHDLFEASARPVEWSEPRERDQIVICDADINAETQMFNAGVEARERAKASSRAAERRALNFCGDREDGDLSETQKHDLWSKPSNDPADW